MAPNTGTDILHERYQVSWQYRQYNSIYRKISIQTVNVCANIEKYMHVTINMYAYVFIYA